MDTILLLASESAPVWNPIVDEFNATHKHRIAVQYLPAFSALQHSLRSSKFDFCLNIDNPVMFGFINDTSSFIDLSPILTELDTTRYYPTLTVVESCRPDMGDCTQSNRPGIVLQPCCFQDTRRQIYLGRIPRASQGDCPEKACRDALAVHLQPLLRILVCPGVRLLNPETLRFNPSSSLKAALDDFKNFISADLAPLISDVYLNREDLRLFYGNCAAIKGFNMPLLPMDRNYRVMPFPVTPGQSNVVYYEFFSIRSDSMNYRTAWDFIKFAISAKAQRMMALSSHTMPVMRGIAPAFLKKNEFRLFADYLENGVSIPEQTYFTFANRNILESAIDRYLRFGGSYPQLLAELENSFCCVRTQEPEP